ncbi:MAG: Heavy-metal resistance [Verrucomicrobiota bacterium]
MKMKPTVLWLMLAILTSGAVTALQAQPTNPSSLRPGRPGQLPAAAMGRFAPGYERLMGVLTEEQRNSLRAAMEDQREKVRELEEKTRDARKELFEAGLTEKFDEAAVRQKATGVAKVDAEIIVLRMKAFSQMRPSLSAEQIQKLKDLTPGGAENRGEASRSRPDIKRDENGLPLKKPAPTAKPPEN